MARVKLSEYEAKSLLVDAYQGVSIHLESLDADIAKLDDSLAYIIKVDQGVKKRGKQGLLRPNIHASDAHDVVVSLSEHGFTQYIAEPMLEHMPDEEKYVSFERTRAGIEISYNAHGGIEVEEYSGKVQHFFAHTIEADSPLQLNFIDHIVDVMNAQDISFIEINPLVVQGDTYHILDAAVLADSAGSFRDDWLQSDVVDPHTPSETEKTIAQMNATSPSTFSFRVLNPDGAIWLLLSGGGASITIADEASNQGKADLIGNYGEYSGGPTTEETYLYTKAVLEQMFKSNTSKKALVIAGGVANFTDVKKTFTGVIQAIDEVKQACMNAQVRVYVRRGGPNEKEGLSMMRQFLQNNDLYGSVNGSDVVLTNVINEALEYVDA